MKMESYMANPVSERTFRKISVYRPAGYVYALSASILCLWTAGEALAGVSTQNIYPEPVVSTIEAGAVVPLDVMYNTSDANAALTGIGVRVHYDSSKLKFDQVTETLANGRLFNPGLVVPEVDAADFDDDPATDRFIAMAWVDFGGNWPGTLPEKLAAVQFTAAGDFSGSASVRFSASDLAAGYGFSSQPATIETESTFLLTASTSGSGSGTVTSNPAGIDCGGDCIESYIEGTTVTLSAVAEGGSHFVSWGGSCSGSNLSTPVLVDADKTCDAQFDLDSGDASQQIYADPGEVGAQADGSVQFDMMYDVSDANATLTGIGVRVHFDSTELDFDQVTETLASGRLFNPDLVTPEADTEDYDGDPSTDSYLSLAWVDFGGNWPGALPEKLAAMLFVTKAGFSGQTIIRFSSSDLAAGYTFSSTPVIVSQDVVFADGFESP